MPVKNISPPELKEMLLKEEDIKLIDVREQWEHNIARINGSELAPVRTFSEYYKKLDVNEKIVVFCHHGSRSYKVCQFMIQNGFKNIYNLEGGINAWSLEIDNSISQY
ncbi:MAG: rhodanese-like domain-containing protein [Ignavibacteriaceae bacterium]|jgi:adenylyltransferase/sulfurtransferase